MTCTNSFAQIIKLPDQRRFLVQLQEQDFLLFFYSCTVVDNNKEIEYWKVCRGTHAGRQE